MTLVFSIVNASELKVKVKEVFGESAGAHTLHSYPYPLLTEWEGCKDTMLTNQQWTLHVFRNLCDWIERCADDAGGPSALRNALAIMEVKLCLRHDEAPGFNPIVSGGEDVERSILAAMLILAFPEIHWALQVQQEELQQLAEEFTTMEAELSAPPSVPASIATPNETQAANPPSTTLSNDKRIIDELKKAHLFTEPTALWHIKHLHDDGFAALFDPHGLRHFIRHRINSKNKAVAADARAVAEAAAIQGADATATPPPPLVSAASAPSLRIRAKAAASIDEEEAYAYLNAYVAYRFGYRTHLVTTYSLMRRVFPHYIKEDKNLNNPFVCREETRNNPCQIKLVFEDLYLSFADMESGTHLSTLETRDQEKYHGGLTRVEHRIIVTAGQKNQETNEKYLRAKIKDYQYIYKPFTGIFDVGNQAEMLCGQKRSALAGNASDKNTNKNTNDTRDADTPDNLDDGNAGLGHSAPGRLLEVANRLLHRANRLSRSAQSVADAVQGALLCMEAQEYLNHRPPTMALDVLARKHQLEVMAECMFYGVETNIDLRFRMKELTEDIESIGKNFQVQSQRTSALNAELGIVSELAMLFKRYNQFDEELTCLAKVRELNRKVWSARRKKEMQDSFASLHSKQGLVAKPKDKLVHAAQPRRDAGRWATFKSKPACQLANSALVFGLNGILLPVRVYITALLNRLYFFFIAIVFWVFLLGVFYSWSESSSAPPPVANSMPSVTPPDGFDDTLAKANPRSNQGQPMQEPGGTVSATQNPPETNAASPSHPYFATKRGFAYAVTTFFGVQPPTDIKNIEKWGGPAIGVTIIAIMLAFMHLGIFVSHLYVMISRR